ncbi:MAG: sulfurtransferase [Nocardiopsaceae bacterium]|nr:sulfurtransferase [Nocardiopsaceae bacterium]
MSEISFIPGPPVVLDVRWRLGGPPGVEDYRAGHIPGAVFVDLDRDLAAPPGRGGRHPLPSPADFQAAMRRLGVSDGRPVVAYDAADSTAAARAWWLLRYFGHRDVRVLDGGYRAWTEAGLPSEAGPSPAESGLGPAEADPAVAGAAPVTGPGSAGPGPVSAGDFTARPGHLPLLDADAAAALAGTGLLLDARAGERYRGETEPADPVAGHIPGAISAPTAENVTPGGTFRTPAELAARFAALGVPAPGSGKAGSAPHGPDGAAPVVGAYCGSGVTAAHEVLALSLAGIPAALYAGSWSDWITDPSRPVATGPDAG